MPWAFNSGPLKAATLRDDGFVLQEENRVGNLTFGTNL